MLSLTGFEDRGAHQDPDATAPQYSRVAPEGTLGG